MHLAEKILTSRAALEGERKQVTVLFADLKGSMEQRADRDCGTIGWARFSAYFSASVTLATIPTWTPQR